MKNNETNARFPSDLKKAKKIMKDAHYAMRYFENECKAIPALISQAKSQYEVKIGKSQLTRLILSELYITKLSRLKTYRGECSLDKWIEKYFGQMLYPIFVDEGLIHSSSRTYRKPQPAIMWDEASYETCCEMISLLQLDFQRLILRRCYLEGLTIDDILPLYDGYTREDVVKLHDDACATLAKILINSNSGYKEYVKVESKPSFVGIEVLDFLCDENTTEEDCSHLARFYDFLHLLGGYEDPMENFRVYIEKVGAESHWTARAIDILVQRLIYKTPPVELARKHNVARAYVDNKFSQYRRHLVDYMRTHPVA